MYFLSFGLLPQCPPFCHMQPNWKCRAITCFLMNIPSVYWSGERSVNPAWLLFVSLLPIQILPDLCIFFSCLPSFVHSSPSLCTVIILWVFKPPSPRFVIASLSLHVFLSSLSFTHPPPKFPIATFLPVPSVESYLSLHLLLSSFPSCTHSLSSPFLLLQQQIREIYFQHHGQLLTWPKQRVAVPPVGRS